MTLKGVLRHALCRGGKHIPTAAVKLLQQPYSQEGVKTMAIPEKIRIERSCTCTMRINLAGSPLDCHKSKKA
jgi:hypothetical protein